MIEGTRTIDWVMLVVEVLVLGLIAYEVIIGEVHRRQERRRHSEISERVLGLTELMQQGDRLRDTVLDPQITNAQLIQPWIKSVNEWTEKTNAFLSSHSPRASSAFMLITDAPNVASWVRASGREFQLTGLVRECYQRLVVQLANLQRILERPEVYF